MNLIEVYQNQGLSKIEDLCLNQEINEEDKNILLCWSIFNKKEQLFTMILPYCNIYENESQAIYMGLISKNTESLDQMLEQNLNEKALEEVFNRYQKSLMYDSELERRYKEYFRITPSVFKNKF